MYWKHHYSIVCGCLHCCACIKYSAAVPLFSLFCVTFCTTVFLQNWQSKLQSAEIFEYPEIVYKVGIADGGRAQFWFGHQCLCSWPSLAFFLDAVEHERCWRCGMQWSCGCLCQGACGYEWRFAIWPFWYSEIIDSYREARQWRWAMTLCQNCDALGRSFALEAWTCKCRSWTTQTCAAWGNSIFASFLVSPGLRF